MKTHKDPGCMWFVTVWIFLFLRVSLSACVVVVFIVCFGAAFHPFQPSSRQSPTFCCQSTYTAMIHLLINPLQFNHAASLLQFLPECSGSRCGAYVVCSLFWLRFSLHAGYWLGSCFFKYNLDYKPEVSQIHIFCCISLSFFPFHQICIFCTSISSK